MSYLVDRYSRSGFQSQDLLWSGQGVQLTHNALRLLSKWDLLTAETVFSPPSVSPWLLWALLQPRRSSARHGTARAPSGPSTPTPCTRDFTVSLEKKHPSAPSQTGSNPSPSAVAMVMHRMSHRGVNPLEVIKVITCYHRDQEYFMGYQGKQVFYRLPRWPRVFWRLSWGPTVPEHPRRKPGRLDPRRWCTV